MLLTVPPLSWRQSELYIILIGSSSSKSYKQNGGKLGFVITMNEVRLSNNVKANKERKKTFCSF